MNRNYLLKLARYVVKAHPHILKDLPPCEIKPLENINNYLFLYDKMIISRAWQPEDRKIFATAMYNIYEDQYKFKGVLSKLLCVAPPTITSIIKECDFRYKKDLYFREKVINFENYIKNNNNATI